MVPHVTHDLAGTVHLWGDPESPPPALFEMDTEETRKLITLLAGALVRIEGGRERTSILFDEILERVKRTGDTADTEVLHLTLDNGQPWTMRLSELRNPDFVGKSSGPGTPLLWVMHHTVLLRAPMGFYRAWTWEAPPPMDAMIAIEVCFGKLARTRVESRFTAAHP